MCHDINTQSAVRYVTNVYICHHTHHMFGCPSFRICVINLTACGPAGGTLLRVNQPSCGGMRVADATRVAPRQGDHEMPQKEVPEADRPMGQCLLPPEGYSPHCYPLHVCCTRHSHPVRLGDTIIQTHVRIATLFIDILPLVCDTSTDRWCD